MIQTLLDEGSPPWWVGAAPPTPGQRPTPEPEDTTTGDDTDGEGSIGEVETPRWAGRRRRSWSGGRRGDGDGEDAAGLARGRDLLSSTCQLNLSRV
jgi:hypothetical protein